MRAAFLDRDGTITRDYPDQQWASVAQPELLHGTTQALVEFRRMGYEVIILTNQYTIGEGIITPSDYKHFTALLLADLHNAGASVLDIFHCPHARTVPCRCRKPNVGMVEQALHKYPAIDLSRSFMAGDSECDRQLAEATGLRFFGVALPSAGTPIKSLAEIPALLRG